jgi:hypothetical protein
VSDIKIPNETAAQLRPLAAALNLKMKRGPGLVAEFGSIPALLVMLGTCYEAEPERVEQLMRQALRMNEEWCVCQMPKHECICEDAPKAAQ